MRLAKAASVAFLLSVGVMWTATADAASALIDFSQGATNPPAGQAMIGVTGTAVSIHNGTNSGIASWQIDLTWAPNGSALVAGTLASSNSGNTPSATFTPDVSGSYRIALYVWALANRAGPPADTDIRVVSVPEPAKGYIRPPLQIWPRPLPPLASGSVGAKPNEMNFDGRELGFVGNAADGLLDQQIKEWDAFSGGGGGGLTAPVADASLANMSGLSVKGRSANTTGVPGSIVAVTDGHVLRLSGTTLAFGPLAAGAFADSTIAPSRLTTTTAGTFGSATAVSVCTFSSGVATSCSSTTISVPSTAISDSTAAGRTLFTGASASAQRTSLGLVIGTDVQAFNANLGAIAGQTTAADRLTYWTGSGTAALATFTAAARTWTAAADAAAETALLNPFTSSLAGLVPASGGGTTTFLRADGTFSAPSGGGDALTTNPLSQFASTTSAQLATVLSDETGTGGGFVRATNPTFGSYNVYTAIAAPTTPGAGLSRCYIDSTSLNWACKNASGVVAHAVQTIAATTSQYVTAIDDDGTVHQAGVGFTDLTGTITGAQIPSATVSNAKLTNMANATTKCRTTAGTGVPEDCTASQEKALLAIAASDVSGLSTVATTGAISDTTGTLAVARGGTGVTSSTGTVNVVLSNSPTLVTPTLGAATATSVNKVAVTAPASSATLTIADGATLTASASATVSGTNTGDQTVSTMGASGALTDGTGTLLLTHGGTGQTTAVAAEVALQVKGADIASASTVDLATATGTFVHVTGTTTITSFGTVAAGARFAIEYTGALTITHNATSLILSTAANRTTVAGDVQVVVSEGAGNWREVSYHKTGTGPLLASNNLSDVASAATSRTNLGLATVASSASATDLSSGTLALARGGTGQATAGAAFDALTVQGAAIASATTTSIAGQVGHDVHITGTTTITSFGNCTAGAYRIVHFDGALTLTHNATSLILLTGANRTTAAGDVELVTCDSTNNWREAFYNYVMPDPIGEFDTGNSGTTKTIDFSLHRLNKSTLTGNVTYTFTAPTRANNVVLHLLEDGTGGRTITLPASVKFTGGTTPTFTTTANAHNVLACYTDATNYYCSAYTQ